MWGAYQSAVCSLQSAVRSPQSPLMGRPSANPRRHPQTCRVRARSALSRTNRRASRPHTGSRSVRGPFLAPPRQRRNPMLYTLAVLLLIAWLLGIVGTYTIGAFVHVLLVIAVVLFIAGLLTGRETMV